MTLIYFHILLIIEKPHFGPNLGHFWPKNFKTKFSLSFRSILDPYVIVALHKKSEKILTLTFDNTWKILLCQKSHFKQVSPKNPQNKAFPSKNIRSILSCYTTVALSKKSEKLCVNYLKKNLRNLILGPFWSFFALKHETIFQKKSRSILKLHVALTSWKKTKKIHP